jgi:hypothetical protein
MKHQFGFWLYYGSKFEVKTDNNPFTYIFDKAKLDVVGHRWVASLSNYDFNLTYRAGKANGDLQKGFDSPNIWVRILFFIPIYCTDINIGDKTVVNTYILS